MRLAGFKKILVAFHHGEGIAVPMPYTAAPAYREIAAIPDTEIHQLGKVGQAHRHIDTVFKRIGGEYRAEPPELLTVVETYEIGILAVKLLVDLHLVIGQMRERSARRLHHAPHPVLGTSTHPRARRLKTVWHYIKLTRCLVMRHGQRDVEYTPRLQIFGNEVYYLLRIRPVPCVYMDDEHRVVHAYRTAHGSSLFGP